MTRARATRPLRAHRPHPGSWIQGTPPRVLSLGVVVAGVSTVAAVRVWLATRVSTPWLFSDELLHSELARNLAHGQLFEIRGEHVNVTYAYPLLIAPAWLLHSPSATYTAAKLINVALVSAASVPVYFWARRLFSPLGAAAAAIGAVVLPELALTSTLMQENLAYPVFLAALFMLALVLESPSWPRQLILFALAVVATAARFELAILFAIVPTAVVLARAPARRLLWVLVGTVGALAALLTLVVAGNSTLHEALRTFPQTSASYSVRRFLDWSSWTIGDLALTTGVAPLVALVLVSGRQTDSRSASQRAFLAVAWAAMLWFLVLGGLSGSWQPYGFKERYVVYVEPLLLIALLLWASCSTPRRLVRGGLTTAGLGLVLASWPLASLLRAGSLPGNALGLEPFLSLGHRIGFGGPLVLLCVVLGAAVAFLTAAATRRVLKLAIVVFVAFFLGLSSALAARALDRQARAVARMTSLPADRSWVDALAGRAGDVTLLNATTFMPETARGDYWTLWAPWWETEFWNRTAERVYGLGAPEPLPLAQSSGSLDWATGRIAAAPPSRWVLVDPRFELRGRRRGASNAFVLYDQVASPFRLVSAEEGVLRDGQSTVEAVYDRWKDRVDPKGVAIEVVPDPALGRALIHVDVGTLVASGAAPRIGRYLSRRDFALDGGRTIELSVPRPPFRIELRWLIGLPGQLRFRPLLPQPSRLS